jgi:CRP-like cAMP-binding protein
LTHNILAKTLCRFVELSESQIKKIDSLEKRRIDLAPRSDFIFEGDSTIDLPVVERGWLEQYRILSDGRRCVLRLSLPGDVVDGAFPMLHRAQFSVGALTNARVLLVPSQPLLALLRDDAAIALAFLYLEAYQHSSLRERVSTLASLSAYERLGHLLLELLGRLEAVGLARRNEYELPVSQPSLGEILGMHTVHVNRMFRRLEADGFITRSDSLIRITDREGLTNLTEFRKLDLARRNPTKKDAIGPAS